MADEQPVAAEAPAAEAPAEEAPPADEQDPALTEDFDVVVLGTGEHQNGRGYRRWSGGRGGGAAMSPRLEEGSVAAHAVQRSRALAQAPHAVFLTTQNLRRSDRVHHVRPDVGGQEEGAAH